jgi:hypothetical protein
MKNKKMLVALFTLLQIPKEKQSVIEAEFDNETGDDSVLKTITDGLQVISNTDLDKLKDNHFTQKLEGLDFDKDKLPDAVYRRLKGTFLNTKERELAEKYGIKDYKGMDDLLSKITEQLTLDKGKNGDEATKKLIQEYKDQITKVEKEKDEEIAKVRDEFHGQAIKNEFDTALSGVKLKYDKDQLPKQMELVTSSFNAKYKTIRKDGKTIVVEIATGKELKDKTLEPVSLSSVLKEHVTGYGFNLETEDGGGHGGGGSAGTQTGNTSLKGKSKGDALKDANLIAGTAEADKFIIEKWEPENPKS